jgi:hypothetical protein
VLLAVLSAACFAAAPAAAQAERVVNGGFETGTTDSWTQLSSGVDVVDTSFFASHSGTYSVDLNSSALGGVSQTLATTAGHRYTLSFWMAGNPDPNHDFCSTDGLTYKAKYQLNVSWNGAVLDRPVFDNSSGVHNATHMGWTQHTYTVTASGPATSLEFDSVAPAGACGPTIDDVSLVDTTVSSFSPVSGITGSQVTVTGANFSGVSGVKFGTHAAPFSIVSTTQIKATVPNGAVPGKISVTAAAGTGTSSASFIPTLSITGFTPSSGAAGTVVTVNGIGFNSSSSVTFNGVAASVTPVSSTQVKATAPQDVTAGPITVTNTTAPVGTVSGAAEFS